jgi:phosphatidylethanolamine-binding protein (PEBP) family uncharacterized protein
MNKLVVMSSAFKNNGSIPRRYTCDGEDVNPPLIIDGLARANITPTNKIDENIVPGIEGLNDFGRHSYGGPCPPSGTHRYFFKVYALDIEISLPISSRKKDIEKAMSEHILAKGELVGLYKR